MRNKLLTMRNAVLALLAATVLACLSFGIFALPNWAKADDGDEPAIVPVSNVFEYDETEATVIIGLKAEAEDISELHLLIPKEVTAINDMAFMGAENIKSVTFEDNSALTEIGEMAFAGTLITEIAIPANVTSIGNDAFYGCENLENVLFANGSLLETIGDTAFAGTAVTEIELPAKLTAITAGIFEDSIITKITFATGSELTEIKVGMFDAKITSIEIPAKVTIIEANAFSDCTSLTSVTFEDGIVLETIGTSAFVGTKITSITIPAKVTSIGASAFEGCATLNQVTFQAGSAPATIGDEAFEETGIEEIVISANVTSIGYGAFFSCESLASVKFATGSVLASIGGMAFAGTAVTEIELPAKLTAITAGIFEDSNITKITFATGSELTEINDGMFGEEIESIEIPASVTTIGEGAFYGYLNLSNVTFANGSNLTSIGDNAFEATKVTAIELPAKLTAITAGIFAESNITKITFATGSELTAITAVMFDGLEITDIEIPASVTSIANVAFSDCAQLERVTFEDNSTLATIGVSAFANTNLARIGIPASVTSIGETAFYGCENLAEVTLTGNNLTTIGDEAFYDTKITSISIPASVTEIGASAFSVSSLVRVELAENSTLTTIGESAFAGTAITSILIPASVKAIGKDAFNGCVKLATVDLRTLTLNKIEEGTFEGTAISTIQIPAIVTSIGAKAFNNCTNLTSVAIGGNVLTSIGESAFAGTKIEAINLPASVTSIDANAFNGSNLTTITIPNGVTKINASTFAGCENLENVLFANGSQLTEIEAEAFKGLAITQISIPAGVTSIGNKAFADCTNLAVVTFAYNCELTSIGDSAFAGTAITELEVPVGVTSIGAKAFDGCANLARVEFDGNNITSIGAEAFANCTSLNNVVLPASAQNITFGANAFGADKAGFYIIANSKADYDALSSNLNYPNSLTYIVTITYGRGNNVFEVEQRLYKQSYQVQNVTGVLWETVETEAIGPNEYAYSWVYGDKAVTLDILNELLATSGVENIKLDMYVPEGQLKFIAKTNIVFDEDFTCDPSRDMLKINDLLADGSDTIAEGMTVAITSGQDVIHNAGTYEITVTAANAEYTFKLTINKKAVNLADYNELSWRIQGANGNTELREMLLYVYTKGSTEYPSNVVLSESQRQELGITGTYTMRQVVYSVARYSGSNITIAINDNPAFTTSDVSTHKDVGVYTATATLNVSTNYQVNIGAINSTRGMQITEDNGVYTVNKTWYIVNMGNWLVDANGADYKITNKTYGSVTGVSVPQIMYNSSSKPADVRFELQLNNTTIGTAGFTVADFGSYITKTMPAGEYKLIVTVGDVTDNEGVYHAGFSETCTFTVAKKSLPDLSAVNGLIQGQEFVYKWDGNSHFYEKSEQAVTAYNTFLNKFGRDVDVRSGVWANAEYNSYYGTPVIAYNHEESMHSTEYVSGNVIKISEAGFYKVYYKISAPNYYDSLENAFEANRNRSWFTVVIIKEVAIPVIDSKPYTGNTIVADVNIPSDDSGNALYYNVVSNNGGIKAGEYDVVLQLIGSYYMWEGQTLDDRTDSITLKFTIDKSADNYFTTTLGITSWVVGRYGELEEFPIVGEALYGQVEFTLSYSDDIENVIYSGLNRTDGFKEALAGLGAGSYILTARVAGTDDFNGITDVITFRVFEKDGLPWWAVLLIAVAALGVMVLVFFILHQKGVLQLLTGKVIITMRTKATVDATIAAVRANKVAAEAAKSIARAEELDRLEALNKDNAEEQSEQFND